MISSELKEILKQVEEKNNNGIDLLRVAKAFEDTYNCIKSSNLNEVSNFSEELDSKYRISKKGYNELNHKMVYDVKVKEDSSDLFSIEVKNNGNIRFQSTVSTPKNKEVISLLNRPNCDILERLKMNSEVSIFSENCELVISKNPYLALKISDSLESDKAVLVWKRDNKYQNIDAGIQDCEYVRVEQIEPYLKNIKVDSQIIPYLTYAFFGSEEQREFLEDYAFEQYDSTYPKLSKTRIKSIQENHKANIEVTLALGFGGGLMGLIMGGLISSFALSIAPIIIGVGTPIVTAIAMGIKIAVDYNHAQKKAEKVVIAQVNLYKKLKNYASHHIKEIVNSQPTLIEEEKEEPEMEKPMDLARGIKFLIAKAPKDYADYYNIKLLQIINAYDNDIQDSTKTLNLYDRLSNLSSEITNPKDNIYELITSTITFVNELNKEINLLMGLETLNKLSSIVYNLNYYKLKLKELNELETQLTNSYIETIMNSDIDLITEETLEIISEKDKQNILTNVTMFINQEDLPFTNNNNKTLEGQIIASLSLIKANNMQDKLLNKKKFQNYIKKQLIVNKNT